MMLILTSYPKSEADDSYILLAEELKLQRKSFITYRFDVAKRDGATSGLRRWRRGVRPRHLTLTTYPQLLVCTTVFYNWRFGMMNKVNLTGILMFTLGLFSLQIAFSVWWLRRYQFGPAEWLWRSLVYGRRLRCGLPQRLQQRQFQLWRAASN